MNWIDHLLTAVSLNGALPAEIAGAAMAAAALALVALAAFAYSPRKPRAGLLRALVAVAIGAALTVAEIATRLPDQITRRSRLEAAREVRAHVEQNFDYVGDSFAREARDIHEGRSEKREIYGEASPAEVKKLHDDGVPCAPLPPAPRDPAKAN